MRIIKPFVDGGADGFGDDKMSTGTINTAASAFILFGRAEQPSGPFQRH
jgi:hypothetical protein